MAVSPTPSGVADSSAGLRSFGFHLVSHKEHETLDRLGAWFPTLIDSVILAGGKGFLGTDKSTSESESTDLIVAD